jgi:hypothetical protein
LKKKDMEAFFNSIGEPMVPDDDPIYQNASWTISSGSPTSRRQPSSDGRSTPRDTPGFEAFWNAYPRHDAKERAIKAWAEIAPSFEVQQAIHAALKWQVLEWQRHDPKFIPFAKSYLRGERWMDEPLPG